MTTSIATGNRPEQSSDQPAQANTLDQMNEQVAVMVRWLLADAGIKNVAKLLAEAFGENGVIAATIDLTYGTITAYPTNPGASPAIEGGWESAVNGYTHPFDPALMPQSSTADHLIVVGVTSRNELLIINPAASRAAAEPIGIEGPDPTAIMRSWLLQILTTTPRARAAVTDNELFIPGSARLQLLEADGTPADEITIVFATTETAADPATAIVISSISNTSNLLLCEGNVAGIYLANRYWPLWRRMEIPDLAWAEISQTFTAEDSSTAQPEPEEQQEDLEIATHTEVAAEEQLEETPSSEPVTAAIDPEPAVDAKAVSVAEETDSEPATQTIPEPEAPTQNAAAGPVAVDTQIADTTPQVGLYMLGPGYLLGHDGKQHSAVTRQGLRRSVETLMVIATHKNGLTSEQWGQILGITPANRRTHKHELGNICGRSVLTYNEDLGTWTTDIYCDWTQFQNLIGTNPAAASTEHLTAAVALLRGRPFEDILVEDLKSAAKRGTDKPERKFGYIWREAELLRDLLLVQCGDATLELANRHLSAGTDSEAYRIARLGTQIDPDREDLWILAAKTVTDNERPTLVYDLKQANPTPAANALKALIATRTR